MVELPERAELVGLVGLFAGFAVFTYGGLAHVAGVDSLRSISLLAGGGLVGFLAAGWLVVYYHIVEFAEP